MSLILVVDDEPDVESLFRQQIRRELRAGRFAMDFAQSAAVALRRIAAADAPLGARKPPTRDQRAVL
jgi:CheY-like chemotaxis protein